MARTVINQPTAQDDEIDLLLVAGLGVKFVQRHLKLFLLSTVVGLLAGWLAYSLLPPVYKVSMVADSRILSSEETIAIVDSWQALLKKGDQGTLAKEMGVAPAVVGNLKSIEAEVNGDRAVSSKAIEKNGLYIERNAFLIHAHVHNNTIIDSLQAGIVRSLKHNPYVQKRVSIQRRNLELLRQRIGQEIADLDSTKASVLRLLSAGNSNPKSFLIDPSALNSEIVKLYEKLLETEESLQLLDDIQVIQPFNRVVAPDSPKKWQCLMIGLLAGLGGALLVIIARQVRERMKELPVH